MELCRIFACFLRPVMETLHYAFSAATSSLFKVHEMRSWYDKTGLSKVIDRPNAVCVCSALKRPEEETWENTRHDGRGGWRVSDNRQQRCSMGWGKKRMHQTMKEPSEKVGLLIAWLKAINHYDTGQLWWSLLCMIGTVLIVGEQHTDSHHTADNDKLLTMQLKTGLLSTLDILVWNLGTSSNFLNRLEKC